MLSHPAIGTYMFRAYSLCRPPIAAAIAVTGLMVSAVPARAHEAESLAGGFFAGFSHPLSGPDHMLAMIAVGLWGAFLGRPLIFLLPAVFPAVMAIGGVLGMAGAPVPPVEVGIAFSVVILGIAVAAAWRAPVWLAVAITALFGLFHGYAHGLELPSMADPISYSLGFVVATGLLHVVGIAIGAVRSAPRGAMAVRTAGALIALAGIGFLVVALTPQGMV